jgi:branched-chain amino acid transport system permease protein
MLVVILNGLTYGSLLFVASVGLTLIFGLMRVVNMAHGVLYLCGAYLAYQTQQQTGSWVLAIIVGAVGVAILSGALEWVVRRVHGDMPQTLLTLALTLALADLCLWIWGGLPLTIKADEYVTQKIEMGDGSTYPAYRLFILAVAVLLALLSWFVMNRTSAGRMIRAGVDNREMLEAMGVNVRRIFFLTFIAAGLMVGLAGGIGGSYLAFGPGTEFTILTLALVVVIIGGMGSITGSGVGAIIVGLVDAFGRYYVNEMATFLLMGTLVIVLAIRPQGLFGKEA